MQREEWTARFTRNLRERIEESGYSNREIAEMLGMTPGSFCRYVTTRSGYSRIPTLRMIVNLSYILHCTTDELIDFGEPIDQEYRNHDQDVRDIFERKIYRERLIDEVRDILNGRTD